MRATALGAYTSISTLLQLIAFTPDASAQECWVMTLSIQGASDDGATTSLQSVVPGSGADVDFGVQNTASGTQPAGAGQRVRLLSGGPGSHFIATLETIVTFSDGADCGSAPCGAAPCVPPGQQATIEISQTPVSLAPERTRYSLGKSESWTTQGAGTQVPVTAQLLAGPVTSGEIVDHQVAMLVLDSDPAGFYTSILSYVASPL